MRWKLCRIVFTVHIQVIPFESSHTIQFNLLTIWKRELIYELPEITKLTSKQIWDSFSACAISEHLYLWTTLSSVKLSCNKCKRFTIHHRRSLSPWCSPICDFKESYITLRGSSRGFTYYLGIYQGLYILGFCLGLHISMGSCMRGGITWGNISSSPDPPFGGLTGRETTTLPRCFPWCMHIS